MSPEADAAALIEILEARKIEGDSPIPVTCRRKNQWLRERFHRSRAMKTLAKIRNRGVQGAGRNSRASLHEVSANWMALRFP